MIQVYTGDGKGKTTAALGLALRAAGAGLKIYIGQFIKGSPYNEIKILRKNPNIKIELYGRGCFIKR
ncbi:MAG: cob(I)yrinic acid a,c-diamide adenosyltransferase, partial [Candidatus Omnitrophota bacterium]